jgi:hypothetical protein
MGAQTGVKAMADELDSDFAADERIFHYTSSAGLYGILENECLWATNFRFLNDSKEFMWARASLIDFVKYEVHRKIAALKVTGQVQLPRDVVLRDLSAHEAEVIIDAMYTATMNIGWWFVFSGFIGDQKHQDYNQGGQLHWTTYGRGGGYAVRLNPHIIKPLFQQEAGRLLCGFRSSRVFYADQKTPKELSSDYEIIGRVAQEMIVALGKGDLGTADVGPSLAPFERLISILKDPYFSNENEARLVVNVPKFTREKPIHKICVRHRGTTAVPYIKIFEGSLFGKLNPIEAIIIGPHPDQERRREALVSVLNTRGLDDRIEVILSRVPFVSE